MVVWRLQHPDTRMEYIVSIAFVMSLVCALAADSRGRNPAIWAMVGFVFGGLALLVLFATPAVEPVPVRRDHAWR